MMTKLLQDYVALRRATGFQFHTEAVQLRSFVAFAETRGDRRVRTTTAVKWASQTRTPRQRHTRLRVVARFAEHLRAEDPRHELPPVRLFASTVSRPSPRIFTEDESRSIVSCAAKVGRKGELLGKTYSTLYGIIATTGMRVSEALSLRLSDVSAEGLTIRKTKFGKSRVLPLHPTTSAALSSYIRARRRLATETDAIFVSIRRGPLSKHQALVMFRKVASLAGITTDAFGKRPRIHDLRHTFAVRALEHCPVGRDRVLRGWLAVRGDARTPELFTNARGQAMTRSGFEYVLAKHVEAATATCPSLATKTILPHVLRHTCAMTILRATGDIRKVSLWLGHTDIKTTQMYLRADPAEKLEAITKVAEPHLARGRFRAPDKLIASLMPRR